MDLALGLSILGAVLGGLSVALHAVAAHTKTKVDDKVADGVDFVKDKVLPVAQVVAPAVSKPDSKPVQGFATTSDRDHRSK